ncbi:hypothetical protein KR009_007577, partial [Drosophila setifemur]
LPATDKLRRFCFTGYTEAPVYARPTLDVAIESSFAALFDLCEQVDGTELVECLSSVLAGGQKATHLPRVDESLLILAVFLSTHGDEKHRKVVRNQFPDLVADEKQLLLFVKLVKRLQKMAGRKTPFNRTVRKAILDWYGKQPLDRLLHIWSVGNESQWSSHRDLLHHCHYRNEDFRPEIMAALRLLSSHARELSSWPSFLHPLASFRGIIEGVVKMRLLEEPSEALSVVKSLSLSCDHVPVNLLSDLGLARLLLPQMTYDQLLQSWPRLSRHPPQMRLLLDLLMDEKRLKTANLPPVRLLLEDMRLRKPRKVTIPLKGPNLPRKPSHLHSVYEASFGLNQAIGRRMHITLNLEKCYMGKFLTGRCRSLKYLDALVALAFGYFRSDPKVTVQFWHDRSGQLKTLPWTKEMSLAQATECCKNQEVNQARIEGSQLPLPNANSQLQVLKIKQSLTGILDRALEDTANTYDVFLVLVPGAARGNPGNSSKSLAALMDEYREKRSTNAKFIVVSLRQHHASMKYADGRNENLLELCSLDEHTPVLINAFAHRKFY